MADALDRVIEAALKRQAEIAAEWLQDALSGSGSGTLHPGNRVRSSRLGEYPARQTGALRASIGYQKAGPLSFAVGSFSSKNAEGFEHARDLHLRPPSQGGREFLLLALHDPELLARLHRRAP